MDAKTITLGAARKIGYAEYGKLDGDAVLYFHGTPGSRIMLNADAATAKRAGVRVIVLERPGYGLSDYQPGRRLLDWADDVNQVANGLGITRFGVVGVSGGGPYAVACAYKIPDRLTRAVVVSGPTPFPANLTNPDTQPWTREQIEAEVTDLARRIKEKPEALLDEWAASMPEPDRERLQQADFRTFITDTFREGLRSGTAGEIHDQMLIYMQPWGFSLEDIRVETHIWHGEADSTVPVEQGRYLSEHIPNATLHLLPGVGHLVPAETWKAIFGSFR